MDCKETQHWLTMIGSAVRKAEDSLLNGDSEGLDENLRRIERCIKAARQEMAR